MIWPTAFNDALNVTRESALIVFFAGMMAGLLAFVVLPIDLGFRRWMSANQRGLLWSLVLIRLILPVAPSSILSIQNLVFWQDESESQPTAVLDSVPSNANAPAAVVATESAIAVETVSETMLDWFFLIIGVLLLDILPPVWFVMAILLSFGTAINHWRFCRRVTKSGACADERLLRLLAECRGLANLRRQVSIIVFDGISQPAVMGLLRPKLLLPTDATNLSDDQLRMVMLHELAHVRRNDIAANWLLVLIRAIHWWNPVYWLAASRYRSLREQACDAFVIRHLTGGEANSEQPSRAYGELLLTLAERTSAATSWRVTLPASMLGILSPYFRKRTVSNRLKALRRFAPVRNRWHRAAFATLLILVAICGLTDARSTVEPEEISEWPPRTVFGDNSGFQGVPIQDPGPMETRTHDLTKAIERIAVDAGDPETAHRELVRMFAFLSQLKRTSRHSSALVKLHESADIYQPIEASYAVGDMSAIVRAPQKLQDEVAKYIQAWETSGLGQICVECRFITTALDLTLAIGGDWQYFEAFSAEGQGDYSALTNWGPPGVKVSSGVYEYAPVVVASLNGDQVNKLIDMAQRNRHSNVLQAPKVTVFNGQQATLADCSQRPFVVGVTRLKTGEEKMKLVTIDEGTKLNFQPVLSSDGRKVRLNGRIEFSSINSVGTATAMLNGHETSIQVPKVGRYQIDLNCDIENGASIWIVYGKMGSDGEKPKRLYHTLLTVRSLELE